MKHLDLTLLNDLTEIIDFGKKQLTNSVNRTITLVYWKVGHKINTQILKNERAEYGKKIVPLLAAQLEKLYGRQFNVKNVRRMMQFASSFPDFSIVPPLAAQLSWSHFIELIPLKNELARSYYANKASEETWSRNELRRQIERKAFERKEIAQLQLSDMSKDIQTSFKDPYFLDFLGLKDGYLEDDLESAILKELENFILELGKGFAFIERQKRMILDGDDFYLDLLFYHRILNHLVAIELKLGKFKPSYKGQMELYLKWLNKFDRAENENPPIGLILCAEKSSEQVELLEMGKDGIVVAEYMTELPSKKELEEKLHQTIVATKYRLENKKND